MSSFTNCNPKIRLRKQAAARDYHFHYIEDRSEIAVTKLFRNMENPQERIILIPYTTFWALLESYNSTIEIIGGKDKLQASKDRI